MIIRIVKMTFEEDKTNEFEALFNSNKTKIRSFEGCIHLELLKDINQPNIYFTYSFWEDPKYLSQYRDSELFEVVWGNTKKLFSAKPEAWSVQQKVVLD